ncbi:hypothetical protein SAMN04488092_101198 [Thalassovita taeanensis]|uniref:Peptidoglycan binding-like domain-containing protein n=2 Tax=Thalassovita taeanensis TaxID=657014 RepID=A0A1H8YY31_9RHOB|nr:hypothetical protein SAMN04488092_101198 [Thalassovita taeanensis]
MFEGSETKLITLHADFIVKHPGSLAKDPAPTAAHVYQDAVTELLSGHRILTATDWARSSNSKSFRPPNDDDRKALIISINAAIAKLDEELVNLLPDGVPFLVLSDVVLSVRFGCVSGRVQRIILVGGFVTATLSAVATADGAWRQDFFTRPNVSTTCSAHITGQAEIAHHMRTQLRYENPSLLDPSNTACVALRQGVLQYSGARNLTIDGLYGPATARAEIEMAAKNGVESDDLLQLYAILTEEKKTTGKRKRKH